MQAPKMQFKTVDQYIAVFPRRTQVLLQQVREAVQKVAPQAEEVISYNMPAFKLNGMLVYYAGYKAHIGFYPMPAAILAFKKELAGYVTSKGAIQFPIEQKLPVTLIKNIVKFRVLENIEKARKTERPGVRKTKQS